MTPNSPSHNKLYPGDAVASIDGQDTTSMKHEDAENLIRTSVRLQLVLRRYGYNTDSLVLENIRIKCP